MSVQQASRQLEITIPETLYQWLLGEAQRRAQDAPSVVQAVLEQHVQEFDMTCTRTCELCGTLGVAESEPEYLVGSDETGVPVTNYAEHVDDVRGSLMPEIIVDTSALVAFFVQSEQHHPAARRYGAQHPGVRWIMLDRL